MGPFFLVSFVVKTLSTCGDEAKKLVQQVSILNQKMLEAISPKESAW
jgi:hypothetical protein